MKHIKRAFRGAKNKIAGRDGAQNQQPPDEGGGEVIPVTDLESELPLVLDLLAPDSQPRSTSLGPEAELISQPIANRDDAQNQLPDGVGAEVVSTTNLGAELPFAPDLSAPNNRLRSAILGLQSEFVSQPISYLKLTVPDKYYLNGIPVNGIDLMLPKPEFRCPYHHTLQMDQRRSTLRRLIFSIRVTLITVLAIQLRS